MYTYTVHVHVHTTALDTNNLIRSRPYSAVCQQSDERARGGGGVGGGARQAAVLSDSVTLECQQGSDIWLQSDSDDCHVRAGTFGGFIVH